MSFSDMMSSGRGPGVIGMVMALMVLLGFGLLFMFASDETERGGQSIESVIRNQDKEIEGFKANIMYGQQKLDLAPARIAATKDVARLKRENQALRDTTANLTKTVEAGKAAIAGHLQALADYKDEYRAYARGKAKDEAIAKLETLTGVVYNDVAIREVTPIGIQIRHADGLTRIPFEELPEAMKDRFQFDPKQKELAAAKEADAEGENAAAAAVANSLAAEQMGRQREKDAAAAKEKAKQEIAVKESLVASLKDEIRSLEAEQERAAAEAASARAAGKMHINKSGSIGSNIRSKQNRIATLQAEIGQMKARL